MKDPFNIGGSRPQISIAVVKCKSSSSSSVEMLKCIKSKLPFKGTELSVVVFECGDWCVDEVLTFSRTPRISGYMDQHGFYSDDRGQPGPGESSESSSSDSD